MLRRAFLSLPLAAQLPPDDFTCPMDPDVHAKLPGRCPRCGMALIPGLPDPLEYRIHVEVLPRSPQTTATTSLRFHFTHPKTNQRVEKFELIHERLLHLFLISEDRTYFAHEHPEPEGNGYFRFHTNLPVPGFYRILTDFYPSGGTPQLLTAPLYVKGPRQPVPPLATPNLKITLKTEPEKPLVGMRTMLFYELDPFDGVTPWLGAWGHLLSASADLLDLVHAHPAWDPYGNRVQFNVIFPRPGEYTLWAQFQRHGQVNTTRHTLFSTVP
jgi:hypothetical protein